MKTLSRITSGLPKAGRVLRFSSLVLSTALLAACSSIGPKTMDRDHTDYGFSIGDSWKNQMLTNLVRLRFVDMPVFIDVGQIVAGYSLETQIQAGVGYGNSFTGGDSASLGAIGKFTDRPTITYTPKTGNDYLSSMLVPVEPRGLLALLQAGYDASLLFTWAIEAINGLHNYSVVAGNRRPPDPRFYEFVDQLKEMQIRGEVAFQQETNPDTREDIIILFRDENATPESSERGRSARANINLRSDLRRFKVIYSPIATSDDVLALQTRSILQMLVALSGFIDVPEELTSYGADGYEVPPGRIRPFRVHSGTELPERTFASTYYQGYWYWIEPSDLLSKQVFTLMLFLTTLTDSGDDQLDPVLTISTG